MADGTEAQRILPGKDETSYGTAADLAKSPDFRERYADFLRQLAEVEGGANAKLDELRLFPLSLRERRALREAAIGDAAPGRWEGLGLSEALRWGRSAGASTASRFELWRRSLKAVEGMYGTGVASFFISLRTLLLLDVLLALLILAVVVLPQVIADGGPGAADDAIFAALANASALGEVVERCSAVYEANVSAVVAQETAASTLLDVLSGTGWMERTLLFYGFYLPTGGAGEPYNRSLAYLLAVGGLFLLSLLMLLVQTGRSFQESKVESKVGAADRYGRIVFASWDFALVTGTAARLKQRLIFNEVVAELSDEDHRARHAAMTTARRVGMYAVRAVVNLAILVLLVVAAWLIFFVQVRSTAFSASPQAQTAHTVVRLAMEFLPSVTIAAVGAAYPLLFKAMVRAEDYKTETAVLVTLCRTVVVKLFSLVVLVVTLYALVTCPDKDRCGTGRGPRCKPIACWETYVGQQFYKLLLLNLIIAVGVCLGAEMPRALVVNRWPSKVTKAVGKAEFDTSNSVLQLVYVQIIVWFGAIFCPLLPALAAVSLVAIFYLKLFSCYYNYQPSPTPYKASRSRFFFLVILVGAYLLCVAPIGYCIVHIGVSHGCGPFRAWSTMYEVVPATVDRWPGWPRGLAQWMGSAAFLFLSLILLVALIYYHATMSSTRRALNRRLQQQMAVVERDRKRLYRQLVDAGIQPEVRAHPGRKQRKEESKA